MSCASPSDTGTNESPDMKKYVDVFIDSTFEHPGYCDWKGTNNVNCGDNGEFIKSGEGISRCKCRSYCHDECYRKTCVRKDYSGTIEKCCQLGGPDYYEEGNKVRTCNPLYRHNAWENRKSCDDTLRNFCSRDYNAFDKPACQRWFILNRQNDKVDTVMKEVCRRPEHRNRRECACILATDRIEREIQKLPPHQRTIPPYCMAPECVTNLEAWKTSEQHKKCENIYCGVNLLNFTQIGANPNVIINQECGNKPLTFGEGNSNPSSDDTTQENILEQKTFLQQYGVYVIGAIILLIIVILMIFMLMD